MEIDVQYCPRCGDGYLIGPDVGLHACGDFPMSENTDGWWDWVDGHWNVGRV